jgi:hypothetical protein
MVGTAFNINMYVMEAWPTVFFLLLMLTGLLYICLSFVKWLKAKIAIQVIVGLLPIPLIIWFMNYPY